MTENELFNLGREIKSAFIRKQNDRFQGYRLNKRFDDPKYWVNAAKLCSDCHIGSDEFISCVFEYIDLRQYKYPLTPANLSGKIGKEAIDHYLKSINAFKGTNTKSLPYNRIDVGDRINQLTVIQYVNDSLRFALHIKTSSHAIKFEKALELDIFEIPAWLRILLKPTASIISKYGKDALHQLNGGIPSLRETLKQVLDENKNKSYKSLILPLFGFNVTPQTLDNAVSCLQNNHG